jgi:hypothetical protein
VAVGSLGIDHNLAERWSGGTWTAARPPSPPASEGVPGLNGVSCPSTTHCVAGGDSLSKEFSGGFVDTLNGTTWTMTAQYGPRFKVSTLDAMSCFSASAMAMGCAGIGSRTGSITDVPLSAFLTGSTWTIIPTV